MSELLFNPSTLAVAAGIVLLSFLSEDAAVVSSALLVLGGPVAWPVGFASCFLGIWVGDLGIYSFARWGGRPLLRSRWLESRVDSQMMDRLRGRFSRRATATLFLSRFLPGTRVVTYIAAGVFSTSLSLFAVVTGGAALVWVGAIFALTKLLGPSVLVWFAGAQSKIAAGLFIVLCLPGIIALVRRLRLQLPLFVRRATRWEFWPAWLFYLPVAAYYVWLGFRYRSFTLPSAANPIIPTGGLVGESKCAIIDILRSKEPGLVAESYLISSDDPGERRKTLLRILDERKISAPFVLKPDFGQRGNGVRVIRSLPEACAYLQRVESPVLLQRYAPGPREVGIFYYRFPNESRGKIFSITEKVFPAIVGDGQRTIAELIRIDPRAGLIADRYLARFASRRNEVLLAGEELPLVESGNHAQGCIFRDGNHLWTPALELAIDRLSAIDGFHLGRFDIRYADNEDLRRGRNFQVVELNGAASESTNIYDSRNSLGKAYRILFRQWRLIFAVGDANRRRNIIPVSLLELWREWRKYSQAAAFYPIAS